MTDPAAVLARQKNKRSYSGEDVVELILALSQHLLLLATYAIEAECDDFT